MSNLSEALMLHRREILTRDAPTNFRLALLEIRRISGWGSSDIAFTLNVARSTLWRWEQPQPMVPNYEDGVAILKLLEACRKHAPAASPDGSGCDETPELVSPLQPRATESA